MPDAPPITVPPAVEQGDRVAVVAPSRGPAEPWFDPALERLRDYGLDPVVFPTAERGDDWLRENPEARAEDIEEAFADPEIGAVFAVTGGDDQLRVLRHLDREVLADNPTRFFGFSDNDNLRLLLWTLGVVSFGAQLLPTLALDPEVHDYTDRYLRRALFAESLGEVRPAEEWTDDWYDFESGEPRTWRENPGWDWWPAGGDSAEGPVWGGCLAILRWQLETSRYLPDPERLDGAVLALEVSEDTPPARAVGYTLRSMGERGLLERFDGVLVGRPRSWSPMDDRQVPDDYRTRLREEVTTQLSRYAPDATAVFGLDFGHTDPHFPLPLGAQVTLDRETETVRFE